MTNFPRDKDNLWKRLEQVAERLYALERRFRKFVFDDTGWVNVTYASGWVDFDAFRTVQVRRVRKTVKYRGFMKNGTVGGAATCFSVAPEFRPQGRLYADHYWVCVANAGTGSSTSILSTDAANGTFQVALGTNVWVDVSAITYFVE